MKDLTWPICHDCVHRVERLVFRQTIFNFAHIEESREPVYVCDLGKDRDRTPNICPDLRHSQ